MIKEESISNEWIEHVAKSGKADKILVEKTIRAIILLEGLAVSELDFRFKGGTALMLLLPPASGCLSTLILSWRISCRI
jgi:hypothetical protein